VNANITIPQVSVIYVSQNIPAPILIGGFDDHTAKENHENNLSMSEDCSFPLCNRKTDRNGYCFLHAVHFTGPKAKEAPKPIAKVSEKKKKALKSLKPQKDLQADWYIEKVNQQTGTCMECGGSTKNSLFVYAKACVAHVLPKREAMFPSVATHTDNDLELCNLNGCHHRYDNSWEDAATMKVWPIAVEKFKKMLPAIAPGERKNIPDVFWQEVEVA